MLPSFPIKNSPHCNARDLKQFGQGFTSVFRMPTDMNTTNVHYDLICKLGRVLCLAFCLTILADHVSRVFDISSKEQVGWVYTDSIVTMMQDTLISWNFTEVNCPRPPVGTLANVLVFQVPVPTELVYHSGPRPALPNNWMYRTVFVHLLPERSDRIALDLLCKQWIAIAIPTDVVLVAPRHLATGSLQPSIEHGVLGIILLLWKSLEEFVAGR